LPDGCPGEQLQRLFADMTELNDRLLQRLGHEVARSDARLPPSNAVGKGQGAHEHVEWEHDFGHDWGKFVELLRARCNVEGVHGVVDLPRVLCQNSVVAHTVPLIDYPSLVSRLYR
jgi:hypothetical protein